MSVLIKYLLQIKFLLVFEWKLNGRSEIRKCYEKCALALVTLLNLLNGIIKFHQRFSERAFCVADYCRII